MDTLVLNRERVVLAQQARSCEPSPGLDIYRRVTSGAGIQEKVMLIDTALGLRTSSRLAGALHLAKGKTISSKDLLEQRVSFVLGSVKPESDVTRERIREVVLSQGGITETK